MNNDQVKNFAISLLHADDEDAVIKILKQAGYWDNPAVWRLYGDRDGNYATIGNQQSRPDAALVEKIVNCVDARLLNECLVRGIDPESGAAPSTIRAAISKFIEGRDESNDEHGRLEAWDRKLIQQEQQLITLAATGNKPPKSPCLTLVDAGEGQTPGKMADTFLSIDRSNKLRIPFVQGKFNMGGTGALKFCGTHSLQLIITRRNPEILKKWKGNPTWGSSDPRADEWGLTLVRRERPTGGTGEVRNSVYRYLAPIDAANHPQRGDVLSFSADTLTAMPDQNRPYDRNLSHGSILKLYEYDVKGFGSHILQPDGLLGRTELLLPRIALPVRMHECRAYRGVAERSFANNLVGVMARLIDSDSLEIGFPSSVSIMVRKEKMTAQIYAFQGDKAETYRKNEGIIFVINGQTHGTIPKTFFDRSRVRMGRLAKSLLITVDCSELSTGAREDLFMNSRDRLTNGELRKAVEHELEEVIAHHPKLRELRDRRRAEEISKRLEDSKPLEDVLNSILKSSPTLSRLFLLGQRLSRPHRAEPTEKKEGGGHGGDKGSGAFVGRSHPQYFRFHQQKEGVTLQRGAEIGRRCRIKFETDVENGYFERSEMPGRYHVEVIDGSLEGQEIDHSITLSDGIANWSINLPEDYLKAGDELTLQCSVTDDTLIDPFVNIAKISILSQVDHEQGTKKKKKPEGAGAEGSGGTGAGGKDGKSTSSGQASEGGIAMPPIIEVDESMPEWTQHGFDESTACIVIDDGDDSQAKYSFYINVANISLRTELKGSDADAELIKKKFIWANVLIGLALINDCRNGRDKKSNPNVEVDDEPTIPMVVNRTTKALAPFLVPMIDYLGALTAEEASALAQAGDEE